METLRAPPTSVLGSGQAHEDRKSWDESSLKHRRSEDES